MSTFTTTPASGSGTFTVAEMRETVRNKLSTAEYGAATIDRAFRAAAAEFLRVCGNLLLGQLVSSACTAFDDELDLSGVSGGGGGFSRERLIRAEVGYNDRGAWSTGLGAIARNDLVQGDGDPDAHLYVCHTAHTAAPDKEPPDNAYWTRVPNKRGTRLRLRPYAEVTDQYFRMPPLFDDLRGHYVPGDRPLVMAFKTNTLAVVRPTPQLAYPITLLIRPATPALVSWTIGDTAGGTLSTVINIDDDYADGVCEGAAAKVEFPEAGDRNMPSATRWAAYTAWLRQIRDQVGAPPAVQQRRANFNGF